MSILKFQNNKYVMETYYTAVLVRALTLSNQNNLRFYIIGRPELNINFN